MHYAQKNCTFQHLQEQVLAANNDYFLGTKSAISEIINTHNPTLL